MTEIMDALVKKYPEEGLWMEKVPVPELKYGEVMVKIHKTSICGTDVHIYDWNEWAKETVPTPMTIGHEFVGEIIELGKGVVDLELGQIVSGEGHIVCGKCRNCLAGRRHLCKDTMGVGVNRTGIFSNYVALPASNIWVPHGDIPENIMSIFDPLGNAVHTALSFDLLGEDILITGAGPIGAMAEAVAKHAGAKNVVITDINEYRLDLAKKLGADRIVNVKEEKISDVIMEMGMSEGFDVGLEMSGNDQALNSMIDSMVHGGKIAILGIQDKETSVDWNKIVFNGLHLKGVYGREMYETWYKMNSMLQSGLDISEVITHEFHYKDFQKGFDVMKSGRSGKVILNWI